MSAFFNYLSVDHNRSLYEVISPAKSFQYENYNTIDCSPATGILYLVNNFLGVHIRVKGRENGQYPSNYKEMIDNVFGFANNAIEVYSNSEAQMSLTTVDIRPETNPNFVADGQDMSYLFQDEL